MTRTDSMHDLPPPYFCPAHAAPFAALLLAACPLGPVAIDTEGPPSTSSTASAEVTTPAMTSDPDTSGAIPGPTTTSPSATTTGDTGDTGDTGGSAPGGDTSTTGAASSTDTSTTAVDATTTDIDGTSSTTAPLDTCGDGVLDPVELCDDGNKDPGDGCLPDCTPGSGVALGPLDLPPPDPAGYRTCLTLLDGAMGRPVEHSLVLGGPLSNFGPDGQMAANVERFPLPVANPVTWTWADHAGLNDRHIQRLTTAENGDIVAAGAVYTDPQQMGGFLWLARFTPEGEIVWLRDHGSIPSSAMDLASSPTGDILVAAQPAGWPKDPKGSWVHAFDADGFLLWQHTAPTAAEWRLLYTGVTVDGDGTIYATGRGGPTDHSFDNLVVESFSADGAPLWQTEIPAPKYSHAVPSGITLTTEGALVVALTQGSDNWPDEELALAAFATSGAPLWWRDLPPHDSWQSSAGPILAAPNGGVFFMWGDGKEDDSHAGIARHGASGEVLWSIHPAGARARDAAFGPEELLYVLQGGEVHRYAP